MTVGDFTTALQYLRTNDSMETEADLFVRAELEAALSRREFSST